MLMLVYPGDLLENHFFKHRNHRKTSKVHWREGALTIFDDSAGDICSLNFARFPLFICFLARELWQIEPLANLR